MTIIRILRAIACAAGFHKLHYRTNGKCRERLCLHCDYKAKTFYTAHKQAIVWNRRTTRSALKVIP